MPSKLETIKWSFVFLCFLISSPVFAGIEVDFTPSQNCEKKIIKLINGADKSIDVAIYAINNDKIVEALLNAYKRNVKVRILADRLQAAGRSSKVRLLHEAGINIRVHSKNKIEHNKFSVFDGVKAVNGSYNWTNAASEKNSENCAFFIKNKDVVKSFQNRFDYLWRINTKTKSDEWFEKRK